MEAKRFFYILLIILDLFIIIVVVNFLEQTYDHEIVK